MLVRAKGIEHERAWLDRLRDAGRSIITIAGEGYVDWTREAARTEQAMRDRADVIYQGVFVNEPWRGIADFVVRVATPSALGPWSFEAWDTKLARHPKPHFILQLCWYSEQLARVQGTEPALMHVVLGTNDVVPFALRDFAAYYRAVRNRFLRMVDERRETYSYPVSHCRLCGYTSVCEQRWRHDDHLSLVAGIRRDQVVRLNTAGVTTVKGLAAFDATTRIGIMPPTLERLARQADLWRSRGRNASQSSCAARDCSIHVAGRSSR